MLTSARAYRFVSKFFFFCLLGAGNDNAFSAQTILSLATPLTWKDKRNTLDEIRFGV